MKVLLVYTNRNKYLAPPPIGIAYVAGGLKSEGHEVRVLDLMFSKNPHNDLANTVGQYKPYIVGFSVRNLDNQNMADTDQPLPEIAEYVRIANDAGSVSVLGGTAFSTMPADMLEYMNADYGITGQGEKSFPMLVSALEGNKGFNDVPGLVWRNGGTITHNNPGFSGYAAGIGADWSSIDLKKYKHSMTTPGASVVIKTGCPYKCSYCDAFTTMGNKFIFRDVDEIIEDIKEIKKMHRTRSFFFIDPCFNSPLDYAKKVLERIIAQELDIRFIAPLNPVKGCFDDEFFKLYIRAGGYFTIVGSETLSEKMLDSYRKPFDIDDVMEFCRMAGNNNLKFGMELLFGGPGETNDTVMESMGRIEHIEYSLFSYSIGIRINPGTGVFEAALKEKIISGTNQLLFPRFYVSGDLDVEWAKTYIKKVASKYSYRMRRMVSIGTSNIIERFLRERLIAGVFKEYQ